MTIQNDMSQKDREYERELVLEVFKKRGSIVYYVIQGSPGERKLIKIRRN